MKHSDHNVGKALRETTNELLRAKLKRQAEWQRAKKAKAQTSSSFIRSLFSS